MKKILFSLSILVLCLVGCDGKQKQIRHAQLLVEQAQQMVDDDNLNGAKIKLDSVHLCYPRLVEQRRAAKALMDSIIYIEAQRSYAYSDSLLQPLLPQVDELLKGFNCEKQEQYEDHGRYVHKLLPTDKNINRCFIQAYVTEDVRVILKSYYYGNKSLEHITIELTSEEDTQNFKGQVHTFKNDGANYEIMSIEDDDALAVLWFIANHADNRIKVTLHGNSDYVYYLNDNEKKALTETCKLILLMRDVKQLEQQIATSNLQMEQYQRKSML